MLASPIVHKQDDKIGYTVLIRACSRHDSLKPSGYFKRSGADYVHGWTVCLFCRSKSRPHLGPEVSHCDASIKRPDSCQHDLFLVNTHKDVLATKMKYHCNYSAVTGYYCLIFLRRPYMSQ